MSEQVRPATPDDASFLARVVQMAARSHVEVGAWDLAIPDSEEKRLAFVEKLLLADAPSWCHYSNFLVAEVEGRCAAALSGYPAHSTLLVPIVEAIGHAYAALGWSHDELAESFRSLAVFLTCSEDDEPDAWVVEWVACDPEFRRRGLVERLLEQILERGKSAGHPVAQIGVLIGNTSAQRAYEKAGFGLTSEKRDPAFEEAIGCPGMARLLRQY